MDTTTIQSAVDPVTLSVVWKRLMTITSEIGYRVMHSAQSYVMGMVQDLGPLFISPEGEILTQVDFLPSHSLVAAIPSKHIIEIIGHMDPGDLVIANDSHIIQSGHLPDWTFFRPVYYKDELVCYSYLRGHQMDTGAPSPAVISRGPTIVLPRALTYRPSKSYAKER